ncbi:type II toxin-antitoxin system HigB family toxin [Dyadobacter linearis]|uniref:type II toxin-antitoxin system HigB family toxin n=1 Tax=Dyadobacter linearis TaxID=2823330 RepID=UPI001BFC2806|nr:type II toxin-antitoxin system HigB family toxin [Dyadobacter sp. CECT 9623]
MVIVSHKAIRLFSGKYPIYETALDKWYNVALKADWKHFGQMRQSFGSVDAVGNDLYVFNIGGNKCRLIARIIFKSQMIYIRFIGTHDQYDKINLSKL